MENFPHARNAIDGFYEILKLPDGSNRDRGSCNYNFAPVHCRLLTNGDGDNQVEWNGEVCGSWYYLAQQELFCLIIKAGGTTKKSGPMVRHAFEKMGDITWNLLDNGHGAYAELEGLGFFDKELDTR